MNTLRYIGENLWGQSKYRDEAGNVYVDVDLSSDPRKPSGLCEVTSDYEEANTPVCFEFEVTGWTDEDQLQRNFRYEYMMLSALKLRSSDYLNDAAIAERRWGYKPCELIREMKKYYNILPVKPEWCTKEYIEYLEKQLMEMNYGKGNI